jgi:hypothetical protein
MNPERWRQIEALYHAALERAPGDRAAFLDEACAGDGDLRREITSPPGCGGGGDAGRGTGARRAGILRHFLAAVQRVEMSPVPVGCYNPRDSTGFM